MKIRSLSMVLVLAAVASGAGAGEAVHAASAQRLAVNPAHQALGIDDTGRFTDVMLPGRVAGMAASMPACSNCH